jgi:hypothetical protein
MRKQLQRQSRSRSLNLLPISFDPNEFLLADLSETSSARALLGF